MFERDLRAAVRRWSDQKARLSEAEAALVEADSQKLIYTAKRLREILPRLRLSVEETGKMVSELQRAKPSK